MPTIKCPKCGEELDTGVVVTVCPKCKHDLSDVIRQEAQIRAEPQKKVTGDDSATTHEFIVRTRDLVKEFGGKQQHVSTEKIRTELGWEPMDFKQTLKDTLDWTRNTFLESESL